ncbi:hypothetical protein TNIN_454141 [Trichonephila inaurata madagascariensis]|uniref:Uncharacterized protein n=1 Tax=Trichonephila inaurata madagascariensis TaxID=2747483 RepID=A0A8X7CRJ6_9ARAC|nr:hypothetical protein TNIN_454141 [Trichonephila inaurata madagascariensis]
MIVDLDVRWLFQPLPTSDPEDSVLKIMRGQLNQIKSLSYSSNQSCAIQELRSVVALAHDAEYGSHSIQICFETILD